MQIRQFKLEVNERFISFLKYKEQSKKKKRIKAWGRNSNLIEICMAVRKGEQGSLSLCRHFPQSNTRDIPTNVIVDAHKRPEKNIFFYFFLFIIKNPYFSKIIISS